jgi:hypothetical protein
MKRLLLVLTISAALGSTAFAQSDSTTPPSGPPPGHHGMLTKEQHDELKAAHDAALKADPTLATEDQQLKAENDAFHKKLDEAMIKADPSVEPLLKKMEAEHRHHGPDDGPPPGQ